MGSIDVNSQKQKPPLKLDRSVPFVDAVFRIIEGAGTQFEAVNVLREAESVCGIELTTKPPIQSVQEVMIERYTELIEPRMQRFLSATHLVIGSAESSRLHVLALGGYTYKWTHRGQPVVGDRAKRTSSELHVRFVVSVDQRNDQRLRDTGSQWFNWPGH